mgnify:CR=1 FL=1
MKVKCIKFNQIEKINQNSGIYSWHLYFRESTHLNEYHERHNNKKYKANISGSFGEKIIGDLYSRRKFSRKSVEKERFLVDLTMSLAPPLYIGISNNLKRRLLDHAEYLKLFVYGEITKTKSKLARKDIDTEIESTFFAGRLGSAMKDLHSINLNNLYVKIFEFENDISKKDLLEIEFFLNRTYKPIYGRN